MRQEALIDFLIEAVLPKEEEVRIRKDIISVVRSIILQQNANTNSNCRLFLSGSFPVSVFLPEGDLDLVLISPVVSADASSLAGASSVDRLSSYSIKNVEFVNARTKLVHCVVNTIGVDITVNQVGAVLAASFLEEVDKLVGHNHLFKRSLLLIKCWCYHESMKYAGVSILGSKYGFFSSYSIAVLLIHLFNKYHFDATANGAGSRNGSPTDDNQENADVNVGVTGVASFGDTSRGGECDREGIMGMAGALHVAPHPFSYLLKFLEDYSKLSWSSNVVTITQGVVPIQYGSTPVASESAPTRNHFAALLEKYQGMSNSYSRLRQPSTGTAAPAATFILRLCNIQDPLDANNNLGLAVTTTTLQLIDHALKSGCYHLQQLIVAEANLAQQRHNRKNQYFRAIPPAGDEASHAGGDSASESPKINGDCDGGDARTSYRALGDSAADSTGVTVQRRPSLGGSEDERVKETDDEEESGGAARDRATTMSVPSQSPLQTTATAFVPEVVPGASASQLPPAHPRSGNAAKPNRSRSLSGSYLSSSQTKMPSLLEEFFPRSCITYFQAYFNLPDHHRPTLTQYLRKHKHHACLARAAAVEGGSDISGSPSDGMVDGSANSYSACDGHTEEIADFLAYMASVGHINSAREDSSGSVTGPSAAPPKEMGPVPSSFLSAVKAASSSSTTTSPAPKDVRLPPTVPKSSSTVAGTSRSKIKEPTNAASMGAKSASFGAVEEVLSVSPPQPGDLAENALSLRTPERTTSSAQMVETGMQTDEAPDETEKDREAVRQPATGPVPSTPTYGKVAVMEFSPATMSMISAEEGRSADPTTSAAVTLNGPSSTVGKSGGRRRHSATSKQQTTRGPGAGADVNSSGPMKAAPEKDTSKLSHVSFLSKALGFFGLTARSGQDSGSRKGKDDVGSTKARARVGILQVIVICALILLVGVCGLYIPWLYSVLNAVGDYSSGVVNSGLGSSTDVGDLTTARPGADFNSSYISQQFPPNLMHGDAENSAGLAGEGDGDCFGLGQCKRKKFGAATVPLTEASSKVPRRRRVDPASVAVGPEPLSKLSGQIDWFPMATHYVNPGSGVTLSPDDDLLKYLLETALQNQALGNSAGATVLGTPSEPEYDGYKKGRGRKAGGDVTTDFEDPMSSPDEPSFSEFVPLMKPAKFRKAVVVNDLFTFRWIKLNLDQTEQGSGVGKTREASGELLSESSSYLLHVPAASASDSGIYVCYAVPLAAATAGTERVMIAKSKIIISAPPVCSNQPPMWISLQLGKEIVIELDECTGTPAPLFQWYKNGMKLVNETRNTYYEEYATSTSAGTYSCVLMNMAGTLNWMEATIDLSHH